ncbi:hypothetical protein D3C80_1808370 [compost metagenome]
MGGNAVAGWNEATVVAALFRPVLANRRYYKAAGWRSGYFRGVLRNANLGQRCSNERGCNDMSRNLQDQAFRGLHSDHFAFHEISNWRYARAMSCAAFRQK